jgi:hypothetical protein
VGVKMTNAQAPMVSHEDISIRESAVLDLSQPQNCHNIAEHTCPHNVTHNLCYPWRIVIRRSQLCFFCPLKTLEDGDTLARCLSDPQIQKNHHRVEEGSERNPVRSIFPCGTDPPSLSYFCSSSQPSSSFEPSHRSPPSRASMGRQFLPATSSG